ncbi:MAG: hypothetical protein AAFV07_10065 [Bacteroidota bacterium]
MGHRYFLLLLFISCLGLPCLQAQDDDCRLKPESLKPIIARFNPYFSGHTWQPEAQIEMARMSTDRLLVITQGGCKRHHITLNLIVDAEAVDNRSIFWVKEVKELMHKVFWEKQAYRIFGTEFEQQFEKAFEANGLGEKFNFPVGTRNFICELFLDVNRGARIRIEIVSFIFKERVKRPDRPKGQDNDDGWYQANG